MPPNAEPIVATPGNCQAACMAVAASIATSGAGTRPSPGMRSSTRLPATTIASASDRDARRRGMQVPAAPAPAPRPSRESGPSAATGGRPKKYCHWPTKMMTAMPEVNPTMTGFGMKRMTLPSRRKPIAEQHHARHQRRRLQPRDAILRGDAGEHRDEGAGRPGDLHARAAEDRGRKARRRSPCRVPAPASRRKRSRMPSRAAARRCRRRRPRRRSARFRRGETAPPCGLPVMRSW